MRVAPTSSVSHYHPLNWVELDRLERAITDDLLALPGCGQRHKDIQQQKNRASNTIAAMLTDAFRKERDVSKVTRLAHTILAFFTPTTCRELHELHPVETREQGELESAQMAVAQGDLSTPALRKLHKELGDYVLIAEEMRAAVLTRIMQASR